MGAAKWSPSLSYDLHSGGCRNPENKLFFTYWTSASTGVTDALCEAEYNAMGAARQNKTDLGATTSFCEAYF